MRTFIDTDTITAGIYEFTEDVPECEYYNPNPNPNRSGCNGALNGSISITSDFPDTAAASDVQTLIKYPVVLDKDLLISYCDIHDIIVFLAILKSVFPDDVVDLQTRKNK